MSQKPSGPSARVVARRVLARVEHGGAYATLALSVELDRSKLSAKDRGLATELCYGVLRHRMRLDRALNAYAHKGIKKLPPPVLLALRVGAYQIIFLDRIPAHAAVDDAVSEVRRAAGQKLAGFANGLLRKLDRDGEPSFPDQSSRESIAAMNSMPEWIMSLLEDRVGADRLEETTAGFQGIAPLSIRVNRLRATRSEVKHRLDADEGVDAQVSELCDHALVLAGAGSPDQSQSFHAGLWTVQDVAAQLIGEMLEPKAGQRFLDACAGVGGKCTHLAEMNPDAHIDAIDLSQRKLELLQSAMERLGLESIRPMVIDATRDDSRLASDYDGVLLDAPCSGLGVLRRHPERKWTSEGVNLDELVELQARLLDGVSKRVKVGGFLLYSVCTFTNAEGPDQIRSFLDRHPEFEVSAPVESPQSPRWSQLLDPAGHFESWPHQSGQDAFYAVRLRRIS